MDKWLFIIKAMLLFQNKRLQRNLKALPPIARNIDKYKDCIGLGVGSTLTLTPNPTLHPLGDEGDAVGVWWSVRVSVGVIVQATPTPLLFYYLKGSQTIGVGVSQRSVTKYPDPDVTRLVFLYKSLQASWFF